MAAKKIPTEHLISDEDEARIQSMISSDPENPELTDTEIASLKPATEVLPRAFFKGIEEARRLRGRPKMEAPKVAVTLRVDPLVLDRFKASGKDWRGKMNEALRKAAGL